MEVIGNIELIKKSIQKKYEKEIRVIEKETSKEIEALNAEASKQKALQIAKIKTSRDAESRKVYSKILSEQRLNAKKQFEEAREEYIKEIFSEAFEKAKTIAHSNQYIDFVKSQSPSGSFSVTADGDFFKKHFKDVKIDKAIIGMKFQADEVSYDLSLDGILTSKRDVLRHSVSQVLFNG